MKGKSRLKLAAEKSARKKSEAAHPSGMSKYGRKSTYCEKKAVYGFQVPEPKPWR